MARVPYVSTDDVDPRLENRMIAARGEPVENIMLALLNAPHTASGVLELATALRERTSLDQSLRELAVLAVGREMNSDYVIAHHRNSALTAGVPRARLDALLTGGELEGFAQVERAVIAYASEVTRDGLASNAVWEALTGFLNTRELVELVTTVAWYNAVARIVLPLEVEIEPWCKREDSTD